MRVARVGRKLGVAVIGMGGAVAITAAATAGVEMRERSRNRLEGLLLPSVSVRGFAPLPGLLTLPPELRVRAARRRRRSCAPNGRT